MAYTSGGPVFNKKQKEAMSWGLAPLVLKEATAVADDTTPDVSNINVLMIGANTGATAITQLDGAIAGQVMVLIGTSASNSSTIADSGNFKLSASGTWTASVDETLVLYTSNGTTWIELSRSTN
tara:strand:+ start:227 stop:598 length:372 start_codon:yes stop_codon:yes gene_type:complete